MRIGIIIGSKCIGGAEKQARELAKHLNIHGHTAELIFLRDVSSDTKFDSTSFNIESVQFNFPKNQLRIKYLLQLKELFEYLKRKEFDVIHSFLPESVIIVAIYRILSRSITIHVAGVRGEYFKKKGLRERLYMLLIRRCNAIICNSNSLKEVCIREYGISSDLVSVIPNGVETPLIKPKLKNYPVRAIVVANYHQYKGYDLLFEALSHVSLPLTLHIIGRGDFKEIFAEKIERIPKNVNLIFEGQVDGIIDYQYFDIAIHPSRTEGMSNAIMEELANGLPVIAFDVGGNSQLIQHNWNGLLINQLNGIELAKAINLVINNYQLITYLSSNASKTMDKYSYKASTTQHILLYKKLFSSRDTSN